MSHYAGIEAAYQTGARRGTLITRDDAEAIVVAYLDRVRDARDDDEAEIGSMWTIMQTQFERGRTPECHGPARDDARKMLAGLRRAAARSPQGEDARGDEARGIEEHDGLPGYWVCERCGQPLSADGRCNSGLHVGPGEDANGMAIHTTDLAALAARSSQDEGHEEA